MVGKAVFNTDNGTKETAKKCWDGFSTFNSKPNRQNQNEQIKATIGAIREASLRRFGYRVEWESLNLPRLKFHQGFAEDGQMTHPVRMKGLV
jgi:hypothetical protein